MWHTWSPNRRTPPQQTHSAPGQSERGYCSKRRSHHDSTRYPSGIIGSAGGAILLRPWHIKPGCYNESVLVLRLPNLGRKRLACTPSLVCSSKTLRLRRHKTHEPGYVQKGDLPKKRRAGGSLQLSSPQDSKDTSAKRVLGPAKLELTSGTHKKYLTNLEQVPLCFFSPFNFSCC